MKKLFKNLTKNLTKWFIVPVLIISLVYLFTPYRAYAAIAFDAFTDSAANINSFSHTSTGSNLVLVVGASYNDGSESITGITYNGVALTKIRRDTTGAPVDITTELWYLKAPATGANTVAITYTNNPTQRRHWAMTLTGIDQTTPLDAQNGGIGTAATISTVVTTVADNAWVVDSVMYNETDVLTVGAGQTQRLNAVQGTTKRLASHEGPKTPAGAVTMSWTGASGVDDWAISAASFAPAVAGAVQNVPILNIQGQTIINSQVIIK